MTYILCAFEAEARALIDFYKLSKQKSGSYSFFKDDEHLIFISGMGQKSASEAIQALMLNFPTHANDSFINLGICAAQNSFEIGQLVQIKKLCNEDESHHLPIIDSGIQTVSCFSAKVPLDRPVNEDIAEMEALGLYQSIHNYFKAEHISFLKVVSDNFNPQKPNKAFVISLIQSNLPKILEHIKKVNP